MRSTIDYSWQTRHPLYMYVLSTPYSMMMSHQKLSRALGSPVPVVRLGLQQYVSTVTARSAETL